MFLKSVGTAYMTKQDFLERRATLRGWGNWAIFPGAKAFGPPQKNTIKEFKGMEWAPKRKFCPPTPQKKGLGGPAREATRFYRQARLIYLKECLIHTGWTKRFSIYSSVFLIINMISMSERSGTSP